MAEEQEQDSGFQCSALTDYFAVANDELDLKAGEVYTIIQTSASGWWFAEDSDGLDGWVPSNYLVRMDDPSDSEDEPADNEAGAQSAEMGTGYLATTTDSSRNTNDSFLTFEEKESKRQSRAKEKALKRIRNVTMSVNATEESLRKAEQAMETSLKKHDKKAAKAVAAESAPMQASISEDAETDEPKTVAAAAAAAAASLGSGGTAKKKGKKKGKGKGKKGKNKGNGDNSGDTGAAEENKADDDLWSFQKNPRSKWKKQGGEFVKIEDDSKEKEEARNEAKLRFEEFLRNAPKMQSIKPEQVSYQPTDKPIYDWSVDQIIAYLVHNADSNNTYELKSVVGYLEKMASKSLQMKEYIASKNGINVILNVLCHSNTDLAVSMGCCRALTVMCGHKSARTYPAERNGVFFLTVAIKNSFKNPIFCFVAFNCVCNFTHGNPAHKDIILSDEHNQEIIHCIIEGMHKFRYVEDVEKNYHCVKVQIAACLALQNLAADPRGQKIIGEAEGIEAVIGALIAHVEKIEVVDAVLGVLINLCALKSNAQLFLEEDGIDHLLTMLQNDDVPEKSRISTTKILANIASSDALLLANHESSMSVIVQLLISADQASGLYTNVLKVINSLLMKLTDPKKKLAAMKELYEQKLFNCLSDALTFDYEATMDSNTMNAQQIAAQKALISDIYKEIACLIGIYVQSGNEELKKAVETEELVPKLVAPCIDYPGPAILYYANAAFFHASASTATQIALIQEGVLYFLFENAWYETPNLDDNALRLGCGTMIKLLSGYAHHKEEWDLNEFEAHVRGFIAWINQNKKHLTNLSQAIDHTLNAAKKNQGM